MKFKSVYDEFYSNSFLDENFLYFSSITDEQTPNKIVTDLSSVCSKQVFNNVKGAVLPLFQIDLKEIDGSLEGIIPIFYHEMVSIDWLVSKVDKEGVVQDLYLSHNDKDIRIESLEKDEYQEDLISGDYSEEEIQEVISDFEGKFLKIHKLKPEKALDGITNSDAYHDCIHENTVIFREKNMIDDATYWGPLPVFIQSSYSIPLENDVKFIGEFYAYDFDLCGFIFYLFYDSKTRTVAQLMQMS